MKDSNELLNVIIDALTLIVKQQACNISSAEVLAKIHELERLKSGRPTKSKQKPKLKKGKEFTFTPILPERAASALHRAITICGSPYRLAKCCGIAPTRIYDITTGKTNYISQKLALRIFYATDGRVKPGELNKSLEKLDNCKLEDLQNMDFLTENILDI